MIPKTPILNLPYRRSDRFLYHLLHLEPNNQSIETLSNSTSYLPRSEVSYDKHTTKWPSKCQRDTSLDFHHAGLKFEYCKSRQLQHTASKPTIVIITENYDSIQIESEQERKEQRPAVLVKGGSGEWQYLSVYLQTQKISFSFLVRNIRDGRDPDVSLHWSNSIRYMHYFLVYQHLLACQWPKCKWDE